MQPWTSADTGEFTPQLPEDGGNIPVGRPQSPQRKGFFVQNECLPMYNFPLIEYIYRYYRYDLNIPTTDWGGIGGIRTTQFNLLDVLVANFQSFASCDSTTHKLRCKDDQSLHTAHPRNASVQFRVDERPKGDVLDLRPPQCVRILHLQDGLQKRCVVLFWELQLENQGVCLPSKGCLVSPTKFTFRTRPTLL